MRSACAGRALALLEGNAGLQDVLLAPLRRMTELQVRKPLRISGRQREFQNGTDAKHHATQTYHSRNQCVC